VAQFPYGSSTFTLGTTVLLENGVGAFSAALVACTARQSSFDGLRMIDYREILRRYPHPSMAPARTQTLGDTRYVDLMSLVSMP